MYPLLTVLSILYYNYDSIGKSRSLLYKLTLRCAKDSVGYGSVENCVLIASCVSAGSVGCKGANYAYLHPFFWDYLFDIEANTRTLFWYLCRLVDIIFEDDFYVNFIHIMLQIYSFRLYVKEKVALWPFLSPPSTLNVIKRHRIIFTVHLCSFTIL